MGKVLKQIKCSEGIQSKYPNEKQNSNCLAAASSEQVLDNIECCTIRYFTPVMPSLLAFLLPVSCGFCLQILLITLYLGRKGPQYVSVVWTLAFDDHVLLTNVEVFHYRTAISRSWCRFCLHSGISAVNS